MAQDWQELAQAIRQELGEIPAAMCQEGVQRQTIILLLAAALRQMGLIPVPAWKPPKSTRQHIDLVGVAPDSDPPRVEVAFVVDPVVELPKVKSLEWVECPQKVVVTFSPRKDKVQQSSFFLTPDLEHLDIPAA